MTPELIGQAKDFLGTHRSLGGVGVVGDLCVDRFVFGSVERISPEAPVPVLHIDRTEDKPGCAANVAENLASLRSQFAFELDLVGVAGQDAAGDSLVSTLKPNMRTHILRDPSRPTILKTRFIAGSQHQLLRVDEESTQSLDADLAQKVLKQVEQLLPRLRCLVVQDYAKGLLTAELLEPVLASARQKGVLTIVDPNRNTPGERYRRAGLVTPNVSEAEVLLGRSLNKGADDDEMARACTELKKKLQLDMAIITRSAHGLTLVDRADRVHHFPAIARAVFDVTGAGDTVVAILAAAFAGDAPPPVACTLAMAASSVVVGKVGTATASIPEILNELDQLA